MSPLLQAIDLDVWYAMRRGFGESITRRPLRSVKAVDGVSFSLNRGDTLGVVGESGCGKSTLGRALLGLEKPTGGQVAFNGRLFDEFGKDDWLHFRQSAQMIFQDPTMSLNPKMTVGSAISETLGVHRICSAKEQKKRVFELLASVGLSPELADRRPRTLSGGQCQRVGIARALALNPKIIIADEPLSALDVSVQAQTLNLFIELQQSRNLAMIFISHDLEVVRHVCRNVLVMYLGKIVEAGPVEQVFGAPRHPYTQALVASSPQIGGPRLRDMKLLAGEPPSPLKRPEGCAFHPRCSHAMPACSRGAFPQVHRIESVDVACHLFD